MYEFVLRLGQHVPRDVYTYHLMGSYTLKEYLDRVPGTGAGIQDPSSRWRVLMQQVFQMVHRLAPEEFLPPGVPAIVVRRYSVIRENWI